MTNQKTSKTRTWIIFGAIAALVVIAGVVALALSGSGDPEALAGTASGEGASGLSETQPVSLTGNPLPPMPREGADPALGLVAPELTGRSFDGSPVEITHDGTPKIILFLTHW